MSKCENLVNRTHEQELLYEITLIQDSILQSLVIHR